MNRRPQRCPARASSRASAESFRSPPSVPMNTPPVPTISSKRRADLVLTALPLDWSIVQPSLVFGLGGESAQFFATLASLPLIPLPR